MSQNKPYYHDTDNSKSKGNGKGRKPYNTGSNSSNNSKSGANAAIWEKNPSIDNAYDTITTNTTIKVIYQSSNNNSSKATSSNQNTVNNDGYRAHKNDNNNGQINYSKAGKQQQQQYQQSFNEQSNKANQGINNTNNSNNNNNKSRYSTTNSNNNNNNNGSSSSSGSSGISQQVNNTNHTQQKDSKQSQQQQYQQSSQSQSNQHSAYDNHSNPPYFKEKQQPKQPVFKEAPEKIIEKPQAEVNTVSNGSNISTSVIAPSNQSTTTTVTDHSTDVQSINQTETNNNNNNNNTNSSPKSIKSYKRQENNSINPNQGAKKIIKQAISVRGSNKELPQDSYPSINNSNTRKIADNTKRSNDGSKQEDTTNVWTKDIHCDEPTKFKQSQSNDNSKGSNVNQNQIIIPNNQNQQAKPAENKQQQQQQQFIEKNDKIDILTNPKEQSVLVNQESKISSDVYAFELLLGDTGSVQVVINSNDIHSFYDQLQQNLVSTQLDSQVLCELQIKLLTEILRRMTQQIDDLEQEKDVQQVKPSTDRSEVLQQYQEVLELLRQLCYEYAITYMPKSHLVRFIMEEIEQPEGQEELQQQQQQQQQQFEEQQYQQQQQQQQMQQQYFFPYSAQVYPRNEQQYYTQQYPDPAGFQHPQQLNYQFQQLQQQYSGYPSQIMSQHGSSKQTQHQQMQYAMVNQAFGQQGGYQYQQSPIFPQMTNGYYGSQMQSEPSLQQQQQLFTHNQQNTQMFQGYYPNYNSSNKPLRMQGYNSNNQNNTQKKQHYQKQFNNNNNNNSNSAGPVYIEEETNNQRG